LNIQTNNKLNDNGLNKKSERINLFSNNLKISNRRRKFKTKSSISSTMAKFENKEEKKETGWCHHERKIIDKIKINKKRTCCCFLCTRKKRNIQNILLDEGMRIITEKLDILNMFKKMFRDEKKQENYDFKNEEMNTSEKWI